MLSFLAAGMFVFFTVTGCSQSQEDKKIGTRTTINSAHLDHLYEEIVMDGDTVGIIHIYAEAPDYHWVGDEDEGIACVDDASRAAIFYLEAGFWFRKHKEYLRKGRMLMKFILKMQADNGYFYNFIWPDHTINKEGITSKPEPSWWAWRTLWSMGVALDVLEADDPLRDQIKEQRHILIKSILNEPDFRSAKTDTAFGFTIPAWLPKVSGADQASIAITGLSHYMEQEVPGRKFEDSIYHLARHFAKGILMMQVKDEDSPANGAFLSWENLWHAYGNIQAYTLLRHGEDLNDSVMTIAALYEIDHFYESFLQQKGLNHFWVKKDRDEVEVYDKQQFSQIAYGRRPMIWAACEAYRKTDDEKYQDLAAELGNWFFGDNPANATMYDLETGRGYDGITSNSAINRNAGAESTIECLLALFYLELHGRVYFDREKKMWVNSRTN